LSTLGLLMLAGAATAQDKTAPAAASPAGGSDTTEVVIVSNRISAKNLQLKSQNSVSVLSAADLQHTAVHNAAEILGLMPSVNVMMTGSSFIGGIDGASRGEGQYVSIRSMNSEYNVNLINGVEVATASPYSRAVQLNLIPPNGLQTIVLNKTSMANMDGDAIGGTIDFRSPTAFDFRGKQHASLQVSGNFESQAHDLHADSAGYGAAVEYSRKFGAGENFGVYASYYYSLRRFANSELGGNMEAAGGDRAYALSYVDANGNIPAGMNPIDDVILTGFNVGVSSGHTELSGGTLAFDWKADSDTTYYLHATYAHDFTTQNSSLNQIVGEGTVRDEGTPPVDPVTGLQSNYIPAGSGMYQTLVPFVSNRLWYETNPEHASLSTLDLGMKKTMGNWHFSPSVFYSYGRNDRPNHLELWTTSIPTGSSSSGSAPYGAATLVTYANDFPVAHLTTGMAYAANNPGTMPGPCCYELTAGFSDQTKTGARFDSGYSFGDGLLQSIDFGAKYVASRRAVSNRDYTVFDPAHAAVFQNDTAIFSGYYPGFPGKYAYPVPVINHPELYNRFRKLTSGGLEQYGDICADPTQDGGVQRNLNCNTLKGTEDVASAYVMGRIVSGNLEIIPGARYESTEVHNTYWVRDALDMTKDHFDSNKSHYSEFLPSLFLNYRPDGDTVYRAAIWTSYTRPPLFQLGGSASSSYDPLTKTTTISLGNPDLKPIKATNFDASGSWRSNSGGYLGISLFHKSLTDYVYDSGTSFINTTTGTGTGLVRYSQPKNGGSAAVSGIEFDAQQKLTGMPAPFNALSVGGNVTLQQSRADIGTSWGHKERMQNAPDVTGNFGVYYAHDNVSFDVTYHYSGAYVSGYDEFNKGASWDDLWVRPVQHLDVHAGYDFGKIKLDLSVANLLKNYTYWSHVGEKSLAISDIIQSGRTALVTLKYDF